MQRILIATPSHDGTLTAIYTHSLVETVKLCNELNIQCDYSFIIGDSLVQRARNDLFKTAVLGNYDAVVFIDSDQGWEASWVIELLNSPHYFIGYPVVKKSNVEAYNVRADEIIRLEDGNLEVIGIGTGFLKLSRSCMQALWETSEPYKNGKFDNRMVFEVKVVDGELISEDITLCHKWASLGGKVICDPRHDPYHIGSETWQGKFSSFIDRLEQS